MTGDDYGRQALHSLTGRLRRYAIGSSALRTLAVTHVTAERYQRARLDVERRLIEARMTPAYDSKPRDVVAPPDLGIDPWSVTDNAALERESRRICLCPRCDGEKRVLCGDCGGAERVRCGACNGGGRVMGARRAKNCPSCRGVGQAKCRACRGGRVPCSTCDKLGRVDAWLEVRRERVTSVRVAGAPKAIAVHARVQHSADFDDAHAWPSRLLSDALIAASELPLELQPALDKKSERLVQTRLQTFETACACIEIPTLFGTSRFEVAGTDHTVSAAHTTPLTLRLLAAISAVMLGTILTFAAFVSYEAQHAWFRVHGAGGSMAMAGFIAALLAGIVVLGLTLPRRAWTRFNTAVPAASLAVATLLAVFASMSRSPSIASAEALAQSGHRDEAVLEADALRSAGTETARAESVLDQAHLETLQQAPSLEAQRLSLHQPWHASEVHTQAQRVYTDALHTQGEAAFARADIAFLRAIRPEVAAYAEAAVRDVDHQIRTLELRACAANEDWVCILERTDPADGGTSNDEWLRLSFQASAALLAEESNAVYAAHIAPPATRLATLRTALFHRQRLASMASKTQRFQSPSSSTPLLLRRAVLRRDVLAKLHVSASRVLFESWRGLRVRSGQGWLFGLRQRPSSREVA